MRVRFALFVFQGLVAILVFVASNGFNQWDRITTANGRSSRQRWKQQPWQRTWVPPGKETNPRQVAWYCDNNILRQYSTSLQLQREQRPQVDFDDEPILILLTNRLTAFLGQSTPIASLPTGVVLALLLLPFVASSLLQTILTFGIFVALDVLGRNVIIQEELPFDETGTESLLLSSDNSNSNTQPNDAIETAWIDVFALLVAVSTAYLISPSENLSTNMRNANTWNLFDPVVGLALLVPTVAVLSSQTTATTTASSTVAERKSDEDMSQEGNVNGINGELLNKWDQELMMLEMQSQNTVPRPDEEDQE